MRPRSPSTRRLTRAVLLTGALLAPIVAAGPVSAATNTTKAAVSKPAVKKVTSPLPVMNVTDIRTGKAVPLASTFNGTKPVLVWFWAPH
jgi:hypothetical protein